MATKKRVPAFGGKEEKAEGEKPGKVNAKEEKAEREPKKPFGKGKWVATADGKMKC